MDKPQYQNTPIGRIDSLAKLLSIDENQLIQIADKADTLYYLHNRIKKADGSFREVYGVERELKILQKRIIKKVYYNVYFPHYLHGSIKDRNNPRSHITAAQAHINAKLLISMDISKFFPSLTSEVILDVWKRFFNFHESVAELLTKLTTFNGSLPQGAPTSPGLANLAFWDKEPAVVHKLQKDGFTYTRFVDDIAISTTKHTEKHKLEPIYRNVYGMFGSKGVEANRKKADTSTSGQCMIVHGLNINGGVLTLPKKKRKSIENAVWRCEMKYQESNLTEDYKKLWERTFGRVNYLNQLHPIQGQKLCERLEAIQS